MKTKFSKDGVPGYGEDWIKSWSFWTMIALILACYFGTTIGAIIYKLLNP